MTKTPWFWRRCDKKARGTSGKNRIRPERFLQIRIPCPTFSEQERIVRRIEALDGRLFSVRNRYERTQTLKRTAFGLAP